LFKLAYSAIAEPEGTNKSVAAVATALWAVFLGVKMSVEVDRPQAGGYNICEIALSLPFIT
jgi:hypothetical protein